MAAIHSVSASKDALRSIRPVWPGSIRYLTELLEPFRIGDDYQVSITIQPRPETEFEKFERITRIQSAAEMQQLASLVSCPSGALHYKQRGGFVLHADFIRTGKVIVGVIASSEKDTCAGKLIVQPRKGDAKMTAQQGQTGEIRRRKAIETVGVTGFHCLLI